MTTLILASGSPYRRELLGRLGLPFEVRVPDVDETAVRGEKPRETALRLARAKARAIARSEHGAWVIGSDQVAELDGTPIGKPGTLDNARAQLRSMAGRVVRFHTALCLVSPQGAMREEVVPTDARFRALDDAEIDRYLAREPALDCAGSAKCEGLGIALLERLEGDDPTAIVGLPLIALAAMLRAEGFEVP